MCIMVFENRELLAIMARTLRADMTLVEGYTFVEESPLTCPLGAFGGTEDAWVNRDELLLWREQTSSDFISEQFEGDHFYFRSGSGQVRFMSQLIRLIQHSLRGAG